MDNMGDLQFRILVELSDNNGHSNKELAEELKAKKSNVSSSLGKLEELGLVKRGEARLSITGKRYHETPFFLNIPDRIVDIAQIVVDYAMKEDRFEDLARFMDSDSVNILIKIKSFKFVSSMWEKYFERSKFRDIASMTLLHQSSTIENYKKCLSKLPEVIIDDIDNYKKTEFNLLYKLGSKWYPHFSPIKRQLDLLTKFDRLNLVEFYRTNLTEELLEFIRNISDDPLIPLAITNFIKFDIYLSPLSSFPTNSAMGILFGKPFERLYDDFYLIDYENDRKLLIERAFLLYSEFEEFIYWALNHFKYQKETQELIIRQWIFHWNRSAQCIDAIVSSLNSFESGKYHVSIGNMAIFIADLQKDGAKIAAIPNKPLIIGDIDPFAELIPCNCFDESEKQKRTLEEILENIKSKHSE